MECPSCGEIISNDVKYCRFCGLSMNSEERDINKKGSNVELIEKKYKSFKTQLQNLSKQIMNKATPVIDTFKTKTYLTIDSWIKRLNDNEPIKIGNFHVLSEKNRKNLANSLQTLSKSFESNTEDTIWNREEKIEWEDNLEIRLAGENCLVCFQPLKAGERVSICPLCGYGGHENHMIEWLKIKQNCPLCRESITKESLITKNI